MIKTRHAILLGISLFLLGALLIAIGASCDFDAHYSKKHRSNKPKVVSTVSARPTATVTVDDERKRKKITKAKKQ